jgi:phage terminase large subunit-like protein
VGDGTGEVLWPRQKREDGKWFGFDSEILATKRLQYQSRTQFRAQYYNDPHDVDSSPFQRDLFQYYDKAYLFEKHGRWFFKGNRINVFAAVDFAFSLSKAADYTAIVVLGVDGFNNYYVLDIDRFKTDKISDYYTRILKLYEKWGFQKLRAEVSVAQKAIVNDLKENYIRKYGLAFSIDEYRPSKWQGTKEERIFAILEPKYANKQMWHYKGGNCQSLEEELLFTNPVHDDIKDALAAVVDLAVMPKNIFNIQKVQNSGFQFHSKFGGVC